MIQGELRLRLECKWCETKREQTVQGDAELRRAAAAWIAEHRACANGRPNLLDVTGQTDEAAPAEPIFRKVLE
jgi:hypothetical protein